MPALISPAPAGSALPVEAPRTGLARSVARQVWAASPALAVGAVVCAAGALAMLGLIALDPRTVGGVNAWVKPFKFFVSVGLYLPALALVLDEARGFRRTRAVIRAVVLAVFAVEFALLLWQAGRGVGSHFNVATPFDAAVFGAMGLSIAALMGLMLVALVVLLRQGFADRAWAWALGGALGVSVLGGLAAVPMTLPTAEQRAAWAQEAPVTVAGGHTVGAVDGGPGLPLVGWSTGHGDLRVPHFFGLHALQVLPLVGLALRRSRRYHSETQRTRAMATFVLGYAGLLGILFQQAMRGLPLLRPDALTLGLLAGLAAGTALALRWARWGRALHLAPALPAVLPALAGLLLLAALAV